MIVPRVIRAAGRDPKPLVVVLGYLGLAVVVPVRSRPVLCPFRRVTGRSCPLCGLTRSTHELVRGRVRAAFDYNALTPLLWVIGILWAGGFELDRAGRASAIRRSARGSAAAPGGTLTRAAPID